jgi:hypothetical protein
MKSPAQPDHPSAPEVRRARPEELPELQLDRLRSLDLEQASLPGLPRHVASASGVARRGRYVYVIGDESLFLGCFDLTGDAPGRLRRVLAGEVPQDPDERASRKADLEALTVLPPGTGAPHGALLGIGSGSKPDDRDRGFVWDLAADGSLSGEPREIDLRPVYETLRDRIGEINIEGAAVLGDRICLFHRGNRGDFGNAVAELSLERALESMRGDLRFDADELVALSSYELGALDGVELCFSDATPLADRRIVFTASAEDPDSDEIRGSVIGALTAGGEVDRLRAIDRRWKVEGVYATIDTGVLDLLFVCDQDDPARGSPLLGATMPLSAALDA